MSWINMERNVTMLCIAVRKDWLILKRIALCIWYNILKKSLCPKNISFISLIMIRIISLNQHGRWSYLMQCCLNRLIDLKALSSELFFWCFYCCSRIFCFQHHFFLLRLNLTPSTNIELLTAPCNVDQIDWFALK